MTLTIASDSFLRRNLRGTTRKPSFSMTSPPLRPGGRIRHRPFRQRGHARVAEFARPIEPDRGGHRRHRHPAPHDPRRAARMNVHRQTVKLILDLAHQLLDHVFQCHHPQHGPFFGDDEDDVRLLLDHDLQQGREDRIFLDPVDRPGDSL